MRKKNSWQLAPFKMSSADRAAEVDDWARTVSNGEFSVLKDLEKCLAFLVRSLVYIHMMLCMCSCAVRSSRSCLRHQRPPQV